MGSLLVLLLLLLPPTTSYFSREEEQLLAWLPGVRQPLLLPPPLEEQEAELSDQALVEQDLVMGLVRMDLLDRWGSCFYYYNFYCRTAYLVCQADTDYLVVTSLLACVVRMARHSEEVARRVARHRYSHCS